jgi:hypothetical protein
MTGLEEFIAFAKRVRLLDKLPRGGNLQTAVPRILGQGKTRAEGLFEDRAPALIERLSEYAKLDLSRLESEISYLIADEDPVRAEQNAAKAQIKRLEEQLATSAEGWERTAREVLSKLGERTPGRGGRYALGDLELAFDTKSMAWRWTYRGAYPLVSKLPHDVDFICDAHRDASRRMAEAIVPQEEFLAALRLAWVITKHRATGVPAVLIRDLAKAYLVAAQPSAFWDRPSKTTFVDLGEAVFVINLVTAIDEVRKSFELEKAGVHQTSLGGRERNIAFELPKRGGGTEPYSTIRLKD